MKALGPEHKTDKWCLFLNSSKKSLKAMLLHNENIYPSTPGAHMHVLFI